MTPSRLMKSLMTMRMCLLGPRGSCPLDELSLTDSSGIDTWCSTDEIDGVRASPPRSERMGAHGTTVDDGGEGGAARGPGCARGVGRDAGAGGAGALRWRRARGGHRPQGLR